VPAEGVVAEIVRPDGSPAAPGELGDVVVTSLRNHATPLIRYRLGDRAIAPAAAPCSCGRVLPVFGTVAGRATDFLRTRSGDLLSPPEVVEALRAAMESVIDVQVSQEADDSLRILVAQRDAPGSEGDRTRIADILEQLVGPPRRPQVDRVDAIPLTPGGKVRTLVVQPA
jgi:phenylacetate-CoA ligase